MPSRRVLAWWGATRALMLALLLVPAEGSALSDLALYRHLSAQVWCHGRLPGRDFSWEYPPGALPFAAPPLGCGGSPTYSQLYLVMALCLDLATLLVLQRLPHPRRATKVWLAAFPLLGPVAISRFDVAVCLLLAVAFAALRERPRRTGAFLVAAASVKLWPLLLVAVVVLHAPSRRRIAEGAAIASATLGAVFAVTGTWHALVTAWHFQQDRGLQIESLAALPFEWLYAAGSGGTVWGFGSWQVHAPGASTLAHIMGALQVPLALAVGGLAAARGRVRTNDLVLVATAVTGVLLITGKVLSPQYLLWLAVMVALARGYGVALPRGTVGLTLLATVLTHLIYPGLYHDLLHGSWPPVLVLTLRDVVLAVLVVRLVWAATRPAAPADVRSRSGDTRGMELVDYST